MGRKVVDVALSPEKNVAEWERLRERLLGAYLVTRTPEKRRG